MILDTDGLAPDNCTYDPEVEAHVPGWAYAWALPRHLLIPEQERCWRCDEVRVPPPESGHIGLCDPCLTHLREVSPA